MSNNYNSFKELWDNIEDDEQYLIEKNILDFTLQLHQLMEKRGVNKTELASLYGSSQAYITKIMKGNANFTLETMTKLVNVIDGKLTIHITGKEEKNQKWFRVIEGKKKKAHRWNKSVKEYSIRVTDELTGAIAV
ncbi:MAG: helix-turn-helix domain-containing protein [Desulfocapsa sp.]|nr:helix-turn-helix domain-containing protein [Desulfocapsa sp.]